MSKFAEANEKIADKVVEGYKKIESGVVRSSVKARFGSYFRKIFKTQTKL